MKTIRNALTIIIIFHLSGIIIGTNLWLLIGAWIITLPLAGLQYIAEEYFKEIVRTTTRQTVRKQNREDT